MPYKDAENGKVILFYLKKVTTRLFVKTETKSKLNKNGLAYPEAVFLVMCDPSMNEL